MHSVTRGVARLSYYYYPTSSDDDLRDTSAELRRILEGFYNIKGGILVEISEIPTRGPLELAILIFSGSAAAATEIQQPCESAVRRILMKKLRLRNIRVEKIVLDQNQYKPNIIEELKAKVGAS